MVKLLLSGQVHGQWPQLWERARKLNANAKDAPFELLVCVGRVFPFPPEYVNGELSVPVPTYVLPAMEDSAAISADPTQAKLMDKIKSQHDSGDASLLELFPNCYVLPRYGLASVAGLSIASIAGEEEEGTAAAAAGSTKALAFTREHVQQLIKDVESKRQDLDFLFTSQYAAGFHHLVPEQQLPEQLKSSNNSASLSELLAHVAPRYHITSPATAADGGVFYQRLPYVSECRRTGRKLVTRLIGLCGVNSTKDKTKKYLHALQVVPCAASSGDSAAAPDIPAGTTQNPYQHTSASDVEPASKRARRDAPGARPSGGLSAEQVAQLSAQGARGGQFFYDQKIAARGQHPDALRPGHSDRRREHRPPPVPERTECWFCLATPSVERHLIVSIGQEAYLAMPKGAINEDHVLIVPIAHEASTTRLSASCLKEITRFKAALREYNAAQDKEMILFDRNIATIGATHCHLQVVGIPRARVSGAYSVFQHEGEKYNVKFRELSADEEVVDATQGKSYFYAEVPDGKGGVARLLNIVEDKQYMQFGRHAAACALGAPRRANWKYCVVPKPEEEAMTKAFKKMWEPFDFTREYDDE
ncbi:hypothetical protein PINS_up008458 [Pythium insidiosum]|nr:hypothetical protein PINS_up008458 [Pythium insidiosum]